MHNVVLHREWHRTRDLLHLLSTGVFECTRKMFGVRFQMLRQRRQRQKPKFH